MELNRKRIHVKWLKNLFMTAASLLVLASCNSDDEDFEPLEVAFVSIYQASPNAPDLDINVGSRQINYYPFDYADYTGYLRFYSGERNINFSPNNADNVVADTSFIFEKNRAYSIFTVDNFEDLKILKLEDNETSPSEGMALVRFVNLSPDAPALNLQTTESSETWVSDQEFMENAEFIEISSNSYNLTVTSDDSEINLNVPNASFQEGGYYTIIVRGYDTPPSGNENVLSAQVLVN